MLMNKSHQWIDRLHHKFVVVEVVVIEAYPHIGPHYNVENNMAYFNTEIRFL